jgi:hypothetical protein
MAAFFNSLGINLIYLILLAFGIIYAVIILISGGLHDIHLPHLHIPGFDLHVGGHVIGPVDIDTGGTPDSSLTHVPTLSPITLASFVTAFGAFGLIATGLFDVAARPSLIWAILGGLVVAVIAHFAFGYFLIAPQGSSEVRLSEFIGVEAEVITPIPADSVGEIAFVAQGGRITYTAKSASGTTIPRGSEVIIEAVIGGIAVVKTKV